MSFLEEVGQFFALTEPQSAQLEAGLIALETYFQQAEADVVNTQEFARTFYQKFQQLMTQFGIDENNLEALLDHLYGTERYRQLVTYIVPSYYNAGGDRAVFEELYQEMLSDEQI